MARAKQCENGAGSWLRCYYNGSPYVRSGKVCILCVDCARVAVAFGAVKPKTNKEGA